MRVVVKDKHLNVREGKPSVNAICRQILPPGTEVEVDGNLYSGDNYEGVSTWFRDVAFNYYWSGGVTVLPANDKHMGLVNYNLLLALPQAEAATKGRGIRVAVLDSGVSGRHPDFGNIFTNVNSFDASRSAFGIEDKVGHGTHCLGIIGARTTMLTGIIGVAPEASLYSIKVAHEDHGPTETRVAMGIEEAIKNDVDIINLSFEIRDTRHERLRKAITDAHTRGIVMIAAAGEDDKLTSGSDFLYPAMYPECIAVGAISPGFTGKTFHPKVKYLLPFVPFESCDAITNGHIQKRGSSMAAAFISGIAALLLASAPRRRDPGVTEAVCLQLNNALLPINQMGFNVNERITPVKLSL